MSRQPLNIGFYQIIRSTNYHSNGQSKIHVDVFVLQQFKYAIQMCMWPARRFSIYIYEYIWMMIWWKRRHNGCFHFAKIQLESWNWLEQHQYFAWYVVIYHLYKRNQKEKKTKNRCISIYWIVKSRFGVGRIQKYW